MPVILSNPDHGSDRLLGVVRAILGSTELCSMATLAADGAPHINTAYFAFDDDLRLFFLSNPAALHCRNIARRPAMAVAVFDTRQPWGAPGKGLQLFGVGAPAAGDAAGYAKEVYGARFPRFRELVRSSDPSAGGPSFRSLRLYQFTPNLAKILDEELLADEVNIAAEIRR